MSRSHGPCRAGMPGRRQAPVEACLEFATDVALNVLSDRVNLAQRRRTKAMRIRTVLLALPAIAVLLAAPAAQADWRGHGYGGHYGPGYGHGGYYGGGYYRGGYYGGGYPAGAVIGGALLGLGVGAVVAGALAPPVFVAPPPVVYAAPPVVYAAPPVVYAPRPYYGW